MSLDHRRITLTVRPGSSQAKRAEVMHEWHKSLLHEAVPALIEKWEPKLERRGGRLLPPADEDQVGKLQPPGADTSA